MDLFWGVLGVALDNPGLQEQLTKPLADFAREKLPAADDAAVGDLFIRLGTEIKTGKPPA